MTASTPISAAMRSPEPYDEVTGSIAGGSLGVVVVVTDGLGAGLVMVGVGVGVVVFVGQDGGP